MRKNAIEEVREEMETNKHTSIREGELVSGSMCSIQLEEEKAL